MGRPMKYKDSDKLNEDIKKYFRHCDEEGKPYTIAGLALWLDVDRHTIYNYEKKEQFFHIIKKARDVILASWEERVISEGKPGQIFLMKNYGYTDKSEREQDKIKADTDFVKTRTEALKGVEKDTAFMNELIKTVKGGD